MTDKTLTSPTINGATLSGTLTGTYTIGGTPTFPSSVTQNTAPQILTNKTLTSPTINSPSITNATITADTLSGYTTSNSGSIYGMSVTGGVLASAALAGAVNNAAVASGGLYTSKVYIPYKFQYYLAGTVTNPGDAWTQMKFDTEVFDTGSNYSISTNKFTAPIAGFYQFNTAYGCSTTSDGQTLAIGMNVNTFSSSPTYQGSSFSNGAAAIAVLSISKFIKLNANDTVSIYFYNNSATQLAGTTPMYTYFEGFLVGAT
jgi:hypothetical protein